MGVDIVFGEVEDVLADVGNSGFDEFAYLIGSQVVYLTVAVNGVDRPV